MDDDGVSDVSDKHVRVLETIGLVLSFVNATVGEKCATLIPQNGVGQECASCPHLILIRFSHDLFDPCLTFWQVHLKQFVLPDGWFVKYGYVHSTTFFLTSGVLQDNQILAHKLRRTTRESQTVTQSGALNEKINYLSFRMAYCVLL